MTVGEIIKNLRDKRSVSQKHLAKSVGITQGYLSLVESGQRDATVELIKKIADALEIPQQLLFVLSCDPPTNLKQKTKNHFKRVVSIFNEILEEAEV